MPGAYACIKLSEYPPPFVDSDCFVAVNKQMNANKFIKMWKIFSSVFQKWDTGNYAYNFKEILACHPRVETVRIGQYHESDFVLPGELVDKGAWPVVRWLWAPAANCVCRLSVCHTPTLPFPLNIIYLDRDVQRQNGPN